jgi:hypothetical protein
MDSERATALSYNKIYVLYVDLIRDKYACCHHREV